MRLTRVYRFSASHRLHCPSFTDAENRDLYGKCNNPYGHGHDYIVRVTVGGEVHPDTGRVVDVGALDRFVRERVLCVYGEKDLNKDIPGFEGVPTSENLVADIAKRLRDGWERALGPSILVRIWLQETPRNAFEMRME
jgi:6-pyruvoyltetrahydropterin/6-carboxytetrahydropterin synthase